MQSITHGARWWRFDFHAHTPKSQIYNKDHHENYADWKDGETTLEEWLDGLVNAGIECVAATDHNAVEAIDELNTLTGEHGPFFQKIWVFPGVELTVNAKHFLVLFDVGTSASKIKDFLVLGFNPLYHSQPTWQAQKTVYECAELAKKHKALFIPAHIDKGKGIFHVDATKTPVQTLPAEYSDIFRDGLVSALEVHSLELDNKFGTAKDLPTVLGSDGHRIAELGSSFTWVKMGQRPSILGLGLALNERQTICVPREQASATVPPSLPNNWIKNLTIRNYQFAGASKQKTWNFSPWLTTIIGGRGTGKSSILRVLGNSMTGQVEKVFTQDSFFSADSSVTIEATSFNSLFAVSTKRKEAPVLLIDDISKDTNLLHDWASYFDQKTLFSIASSPEQRWYFFKTRFADENFDFALEQLHSEILLKSEQHHTYVKKTQEINKLTYETVLAEKQVAQIVTPEIQDMLSRVQNQLDWTQYYITQYDSWIGDSNRFFGFNELFSQSPVFEHPIDPKYTNELNTLNQASQILHSQLLKIEPAFDEVKEAWKIFRAKLEQESASLIQTRNSLGEQTKAAKIHLEALQKKKETLRLLKLEAEQLSDAENLRDQLVGKYKTKLNERFLLRKSWIEKTNLTLESRGFRLVLKPYSNHADIFNSFTSLFNNSPTYQEFCTQLTNAIVRAANIAATYIDVIDKLIGMRNAPQESLQVGVETIPISGWVRNALGTVNIAQLYSIRYKLPEDQIWLYRVDSKQTIPFENASPGQQTTILLSIILSEGSNPILIDQPEDDLDNRMIFDIIVSTIKELKPNRQIILVTHNPNIVVNGDAELVLSLDAVNGEAIVHAGSIDERATRENICSVLEGGEEALRRRFKRVLEDPS